LLVTFKSTHDKGTKITPGISFTNFVNNLLNFYKSAFKQSVSLSTLQVVS